VDSSEFQSWLFKEELSGADLQVLKTEVNQRLSKLEERIKEMKEVGIAEDY